MEAGMARLAFNSVKADLLNDKESDGPTITHEDGTNVIKIDFGKVQ